MGKSPNLKILQALKYDAETPKRVQAGFKETLDCRKHDGSRIYIRSFAEARPTFGSFVSILS